MRRHSALLHRLSPGRLTALYAAIGALWIFLSDRALTLIVPTSQLGLAQTLKGWVFILITAISLWLLMRHATGIIRRSEAARHRQAELLARLVESVSDYAIISLDERGRVLSWNQGASEITGFLESDILGHDLGCIEGDEPGKVAKLIAAAHSTGTAHHETWWRRKGGERFRGSLTLSTHAPPRRRAPGLIVILRDLTETHRQQAELQTERRRLAEALAQRSAILDALPVHVALLDADGRIAETNLAWRRFAMQDEYRQGDFTVGTNYLVASRRTPGRQADEANAIADGVAAVLKGERDSFELEYEIGLHDGSMWFRIMANPIGGGGAVVMHIDVTERRIAGNELMARAQQQQAIAILGQVALENVPMDELFTLASELIASALEAPLGFVMACEPDGKLRLVAGTGWPVGTAAKATVDGGTASQPGFALLGGTSVLMSDAATEQRFSTPSLFADEGVRSGIVVPIPTRSGTSYVIGCHARIPARFDERHTDFLEAISYVLASAIERAQNESSLREQRARLESLFLNNADGLIVFDRDGVIESVNPAAERIFQRQQADVIGNNIDELVPHGLRTAVSGNARTARNSLGELELSGRRHDRELFPLQLGIGEFELGQRQMYIVTVRDLSERKRAEELLQRLGSIIEAAPDMVATATTDGRVQYINGAGRDLLGLLPDADVTRFTIGDLTPPEVLSTVVNDGIPAAISSGTWRGDTQLLRADGTRVPVAQVIIAHRLPDGDIAYLSTLCRDLTFQHAAEQQIRKAQKMEAVGQLVGGIAHDFNNFLTVILGNAELLGLALADRPDLAALSDLTRSAAERGAELTHRLLAFSRHQILDPVRIDANQLVNGIRSMFQHALGDAVSIDLRLDPSAWSVVTDKSELESALLNLAINARDAMPEGGTLTVETLNVSIADDEVHGDPDLAPGDYLRVSMCDIGVGMAPEVLERAVEPFFTTKDVGRGTGLGLSMVYGFIQQAGGHVQILSELGHGTSIHLYLPRAIDTDTGGHTGSVPEDGLVGGDESILVVEDDPMVREHTVRTVRGLGYRVIEASNANQALARLRDTPDIDLVFSDIVMPGNLGGTNLADEIRRRHPSVSLVFTSGHPNASRSASTRLPPGIIVLRKPYRAAELARTLRRALDATRQQH